jgi:hypothetical protein
MLRLRSLLLCVATTTFILAPSSKLGAAPPLTTISDTLFNADGTFFNGVVNISWPSFEASDTSNVAAQTLNIQINNGVLYVQLVPTTNANTAAIYTVQYSSLGVVQFSEAWVVSPSNIPLRVRDVRLAPGSVTGSAPAIVTLIGISDVTGLQNALNVRPSIGTTFGVSRSAIIDATGAIDAAPGNLSDCLHVDGTSAPCAGASSTSLTFVDSEVPAGTMDGSNAAFSLAYTPNPASAILLFRNGLLLTQGRDYTLTANAIYFQPGAAPQSGDVVLASYRMTPSIPGMGFVDQEVPAGAINGVNAAFTLSQTPSPGSSLAVYRNGLRLTSSVDYSLTGAVVTFVGAFVPQSGDSLTCSYRVAQ